MDASLFDGVSVTPCPAPPLPDAPSTPAVRWIDINLADATDGGADTLLSSLGLDPDTVRHGLTVGYGVEFTLDAQSVHGAIWADDNDGSPAVAMFFHWNPQRLVTVRIGGSAAIAAVQQQMLERSPLFATDPSRVLGIVLRLLTITVQRGLMDSAISIGSLDLAVISTTMPNAKQMATLVGFRQALQSLATRYPLYRVNTEASLTDIPTVAGLTAGGVTELQNFSSALDGASQTLQGVLVQLRNTAQDIQSQISTWQGNRINTLTVVTIIFLPISFLTGYFGMNFSWLDNRLQSLGAWVMLGILLPVVSVVVAIVMLSRQGFPVGQSGWHWPWRGFARYRQGNGE